ncbi:Fanconi anemia group B protein isoform X2 [Gouania willdenowi]|uniref:Fanconi anemia group B protein isoform X2 n=1 Tax=Gouania willdenowi TaxID=441366 RepID=UPI001055B5DC|nr:Fanconi anemia group B protein isoform X2 [Gouania willdenowi]
MDQMPREELNANPRVVPLCGDVILFDCKRAPTDNIRTELTFCRFSFKREERGFLKASDGSTVLSVKSSSHVDIVKCQRATDTRSRAAIPCVLVTKKSGKRQSFKYSLLSLSTSDILEPRFEFTLPYEIKERLCILHGPTVLWSHDNTVFYTSLQAQGVRRIPMRLPHSITAELPLHTGQICVIGLQGSDNNPTTNRTTGYLIEDGHVFDGTVILPHPYISITLCILVVSATREDGVLACGVVTATSNQQLVYIDNGEVKDTCQLPFDEPRTIQLLNTGRNGCLLVVFFQGGHVCAVWKDTFQIASTWSGVGSFHVDDFLGCGTDQMLLVFEDQHVQHGQPLERFLLTDLCGISYSRGLDTEAPKPPRTPENHLLTLQALESRLQSGMNVLQELQQEVRVKDRVLQLSVNALMDVMSGREAALTPYEQEGLIALWDCDAELHDDAVDNKMQDVPDDSPKPQIDELWHRICEGRLVVGVTLRTDNSIAVSSVSLSILTESGQSTTPAVTQTHSQASLLPEFNSSSSSSSSSSFSEPAAKRSRQHDASRQDELNTCRLAVTALTELAPLLNSGCVKCRVMLHYTHRQDAFALASNATPAVLLCGHVALDIHDGSQTQFLANPQLKTDEASKDLLCLLAVLERWHFLIDSPNYSLCDINGWMEKRVCGKKVEVNTQYVLVNSAGPSAPMLLRWHQLTPFRGELSVYSSHSQMLQLLNSLMEFLPTSCTVKAVRGTTHPDTARAFASVLEKEVMSLKECLTLLLLCKEDKKDTERRSIVGHEDIPEPGSLEGLQTCREGWQQEVERSKRSLSSLVDVGQYRSLVQRMSKVHLDGDLAALLAS